MRRLLLIALFAILLVGCGGGDDTTATPETVETTATQTDTGETETGETETGETETGGDDEVVEGDPAAGKQVFASNGCGSCHTFEPAGSTGTTGPDLDELPDLAEGANQPLADFTRASITSPNEYVEEGFPEGVMPAYDQLSDDELNNLVAFLIQD
ncbi:MAG TPA: cytochrome c [Gaiellaceae bacterium]|nr:cytochrome c [Gaiellaceae bacterium]